MTGQYVFRSRGWRRVTSSMLICLLAFIAGHLGVSLAETGRVEMSTDGSLRGTTVKPNAAGGLAQGTSLTARPHVVATYAQVPLHFEKNQGQANPTVKFLARGNGYALFLTPGDAVLSLQQSQIFDESSYASASAGEGDESDVTEKKLEQAFTEDPFAVVRMALVGAKGQAKMVGQDQLPGRSHYFIGNDPSQWRTNIPQYAKVVAEQVYPGIDLIYYGDQRQLKYDFYVAPGADTNVITLAFEGIDKLEINDKGELVLHTPAGSVLHHKPVIYQELDGVKQTVKGDYLLKGGSKVGFQLDSYDVSKPLIIDPVLSYFTYLGGSGHDKGAGIAVDAVGNSYLTGQTTSANFPTANAFQPSSSGTEVFVTKVNAAGSELIYSTYLGGNSTDEGFAIAVDAAGSAYVTGHTDSNNFPTVIPVQAPLGGGVLGGDAFVTKLNPAGSALEYSTYLGGSLFDRGNGIDVDAAGKAYVVGQTRSSDFPITGGAAQTVFGGESDAFVTMVNATGSALDYSTYLGGLDEEDGTGIAVDSTGNAYVTGSTASSNFPTAGTPFQRTLSGSSDAFVTKLDSIGSARVYSTYLGGRDEEVGHGIAVDGLGNANVTGSTASSNFPLAGSPIQGNIGGRSDAFVAQLNAAGSALNNSTYLGGGEDDMGNGITVDSSNNVYVTGTTSSIDFPTASPFQPVPFRPNLGLGVVTTDAFVAKIETGGSSLIYSSYLGGFGFDSGLAIVVDSAGTAHLTGEIQSLGEELPSELPVIHAIQKNHGGGGARRVPGQGQIESQCLFRSLDYQNRQRRPGHVPR